jgi:hypothetical protein
MKLKTIKTFKMKNILVKYFIASLLLCCNIVMFADPGAGNDTNDLEGSDTPAAPIDNYIWILVLIAVIYVFFKLKTFKNKKLHL